MKKHPYTTAIIAAGGMGSRMGNISKPLIKIGESGKTAFEMTLSAFSSCAFIDEIVVAAAEPELLAEYASCTELPLKIIKGGSERGESVMKAFCEINKKCKFIAIHDCARPLISSDTISEIITAAYKSGAASASTPVTDTVKVITADGSVKTPKRDALIAVQTPQVFAADVYRAFSAHAKKHNLTATDETTLAEAAGFKVDYIPCAPGNIKLTTKLDVDIAAAIYNSTEAKNTAEGAD